MPSRRAAVIAASIAWSALSAACGRGGTGPVPFQTGAPCAYCRMTLVSPELAAEIVAPGEDPRFYDDIGCLANDLRKVAARPGARVYVADHRTAAPIDAATARYTRVDTLETPMGSHLVAHADDASRRADPAVQGRPSLDAAAVFGAGVLPGEPHGR
jgi:copper chaperone NosL